MLKSPCSKMYDCSICQGPLKDPVLVCRENHVCCSSCIAKRRRTSSTCPDCKKPLLRAPRSVPLLSLLLEQLVRECKCGWTGLHSKLAEHQVDCPEHPVPCPVEGCVMIPVPRKLLKEHVCNDRRVTCCECKSRYLVRYRHACPREMSEHYSWCDSCQEPFMLEDDHPCDMDEVQCDVCEAKMPRKDLEDHSACEWKSHNELLKSKISQGLQKIESTSRELERSVSHCRGLERLLDHQHLEIWTGIANVERNKQFAASMGEDRLTIDIGKNEAVLRVRSERRVAFAHMTLVGKHTLSVTQLACDDAVRLALNLELGDHVAVTIKVGLVPQIRLENLCNYDLELVVDKLPATLIKTAEEAESQAKSQAEDILEYFY